MRLRTWNYTLAAALAVVLALSAVYVVTYAQSSGYPLAYTYKVRLVAVGVDAKDNATALTAIPKWTVSDATLATLTVDPDGLGAWLEPKGAAGPVNVTVSADGLTQTWTAQITGPPVAIRIGVGELVKRAITPGS